MLNFIDEKGTQHSAIAECKRTKGVNGEKSLSGTIYTNEEILHGIGRGWRIQFEDENYCLTYVNPIDEGTRIVVEFDAVHEFFFDMQKSATHTILNGSNMAESYLEHIFHDSGYEYRLEVNLPAFEKENFGLKNRLTLFKDFISSTGVEFSVSGRIVRILEKVGTNLSTIVKKGFNLNELHIEKNISSFITYLKGYGAYKDEQNPSKGRLEVEYTSPLAKIYGKLEGDPIVDERYTQEGSLLKRIKREVDSSYGISVDIDMEDLTKAGYEYDRPHEGDYIMAINKDLGFEQKIRILSYTTSFDTEGNIIDHEISCGSSNLMHQFQTNETSWKKQIEESIHEANQMANFALISADGESMIYYGPDEPTGTQFRKGTTWYQTIGDKQVLKIWNGSEWWPLLDESEWESMKRAFEKQKTELETSKRAIAEMNTKVEQAVEEAGFAKDGLTVVEEKATDALSQAQAANKKGQSILQDVDALRKQVVDAEGNIMDLGAQYSYLSEGIDTVVARADQLSTQVSEAKQTADRFQQLLTEKTASLTTRLTNSEQRLDGFKTEVLEQIQGVTTRLSVSEQTVNRFQNSLSEQVNGLVTRLTESEQTAKGFQQRVTDQLKGITSTQTQLSDQYTSVIETITKNDETVRTQLSQMTTQFNLYVQKGNLIAQLNLEAGKTLIQNKQLVLDAETTILTGQAFIPMAMIKDLRVDAATIYGTLDASKVRTINIDAANISSGYINNDRLRSRSITADKLATNAIQVGFNNYSQNLKLDPRSLNFYNGTQLAGKLTSEGMEFWYGTRKIGHMGEAAKKGDTSVRGIAMNLEYTGDFVTWGYKEKTNNTTYTSMLTLDPKGKFTGYSGLIIDVTAWMKKIEGQNGVLEIGTPGAYQSVKFGVNEFNNTKYPALTAKSGKVGVAFGSTELYLLRNNTAYSLNDIIKVTGALKGLGKVSIPTNIAKDGTVTRWTNITL
ncbi:MAG: phage tail protein [Enterococcus gallinarum]|nr:phage tail protein [Enterococcus gallinarum]MDY4071007.1 phage tail protein [Enterococcus gallinarum]